MAPFLKSVIESQSKRPTVYAEPYAGGAGAAFHLLRENVVDRIAINDLNVGVAAFWRAVFDQTKRFLDRIDSVEISVAEWHRQRETYLDDRAESFNRGFAAFYLNRTNRSGILGARPIGGLEQDGNWKLDARFRKSDLKARIEFLSGLGHRVSVTCVEAQDFLRLLDDQETFFYVDPPYLKQGEDLYLANMTFKDHLALARTLNAIRSPWVLTYDHDPRIPDELYPNHACAEFSISHTAAKQHVGSEYLVVPNHVRVDSLDGFGPRPGVWLDDRVAN